jgi:DNA-binding beta-propeller fold protein YncE
MAAGLVLAGALGAWVAGRARDAQTPTFTQLTFRRGTLTSARFTPDGQTIVYSALWDGQPPEVFSHRLDQPASESLGLPPATLLSVSARSELAVLLAPAGELGTVWVGTLARVPLSGGAVRPVLEDVLDADWSPDGRELAVIRWREGEFQLEYPIGTVLLRPCPPTRLRVSPRGDRVAVLDDRDGVLVLDRTGAQVRLPVERHRQRLAWSPSGDALLVDAGASDASRTLRRVALSGSVTEVCSLAGTLVVQDVGRNGSVLIHHGFERWDVRARLPNAPIEREASVFANSAVAGLSSDGGRILLWHRGEGPPGFALLRSIVGGPTLRVGEGTPLGLSPDGRFVLLEESDGTASRLALVPTGAGEVTRVVTDGLERFAGAWHVDETRLGFHAAAPGSSLRSFIVAPPAGAPRAVTPEGTLVVPGELPGGDVVAVSSDGTVTVSSPEAGTRRTIPWRLQPRPFRVVIRTSGDGRFLFVREGSVPARVARIDLETGAAEDWLQLAPADATGVAHVWSEALTPDGRGYAYTHGFFIQDLFLVKDLPGWP